MLVTPQNAVEWEGILAYYICIWAHLLASLACDGCFVSLDPSICGSVVCPLFKLPVEKAGQAEVKTSLGSEA